MAFSPQIAPQERFALRDNSKGDTVGVEPEVDTWNSAQGAGEKK